MKILNTRVDFGYTLTGVLARCEEFLVDNKEHYICTTNPEFIMQAQSNAAFQRIINTADLSLPDGNGVVMAYDYIKSTELTNSAVGKTLIGAKIGFNALRGKPLSVNTIEGVKLAYEICRLSAEKKYSIFFLGGAPRDKKGKPVLNSIDLASLAAQKIKEVFPKANIIGATSKFTPKESDDIPTIEYIQTCMKEKGINRLDFLFVSYGQIKQEEWITRNMHKIPANISIGLGRTFDYFSKLSKESPEGMKKHKIGWIYSLIKEPWRAKRVCSAFPLFPLKVFIDSL